MLVKSTNLADIESFLGVQSMAFLKREKKNSREYWYIGFTIAKSDMQKNNSAAVIPLSIESHR